MTKERIVSVDFLRGFTVAAMILVNNPGTWEFIYPPFMHAHWNGCTPTDLVFPFFLFIVGISITYSLSPVKLSLDKHNSTILKIVKRSFLLFAFGFLLNIFPEFDFETARIPGVLQRISIVFLISAILFLKTSVRTIVITSILILIFYWIALTMIPVPGIGIPGLEPTTNLGAWLDNLLLNGHLWKFSKTWDPEGLLSTLPAIVSGLVGVLTGIWLKSSAEVKEKLIRIFVAANLLIVVALFWDMHFPINKSLWTSSFVLYTSGIAMNALCIVYWLIDVNNYRKFTTPFMAFGSNAITAYMLSELLANLMYTISFDYNGSPMSLKGILFESFSTSWMDPRLTSLLLALLWVLLIWVPIHQLYKRKIFIKV